MSITLERVNLRNLNHLKPFSCKRPDFAVELRKKKRLDHLSQKRRKPLNSEIDVKEIPKLLSQYNLILLSTNEFSAVLEVLRGIRILACLNNNPPISLLMHSQVIHNIFYTLSPMFPEEILEETTWILCNMAAGDTKIVENLIDLGIIEKILDLIDFHYSKVNEHIIWTIANIAGDSIYHKELIIDSNFITKIQPFISSNNFTYACGSILLYALENITKKSQNLPIDQTILIINTLLALNPKVDNDELLVSWIKTICGISFLSEAHNQVIIEKGIIKHVFDLVSYSDEKIYCICLRIIGNILSRSEVQTNLLLNFNLLDKLLLRTKDENSAIKREVYWGLSNIAGGTPKQVNKLVNHDILLQAIHDIIDSDESVRIEVSWILGNIAIKGIAGDVLMMVQKGILNSLRFGIRDENSVISKNYVKVCECLLAAFLVYQKNELFDEFVNSGCLEALEFVQCSTKDLKLEAEITKIIAKYFSEYKNQIYD